MLFLFCFFFFNYQILLLSVGNTIYFPWIAMAQYVVLREEGFVLLLLAAALEVPLDTTLALKCIFLTNKFKLLNSNVNKLSGL